MGVGSREDRKPGVWQEEVQTFSIIIHALACPSTVLHTHTVPPNLECAACTRSLCQGLCPPLPQAREKILKSLVMGQLCLALCLLRHLSTGIGPGYGLYFLAFVLPVFLPGFVFIGLSFVSWVLFCFVFLWGDCFHFLVLESEPRDFSLSYIPSLLGGARS